MSSPAVPRDRLGDRPDASNLIDLLAEAAQDAPDAEFLRFDEGAWTFAEIDARSSQLAHHLIKVEQVAAGDRVAIMLPNIVMWPIAWLGILKAGAVAVPVNYSYLASDLEHVLHDSGATVVITDQDKVQLFARARERHPLRVLDVSALDPGGQPVTAPPRDVGEDTLANLQYTSGTTGFPKACMLSHGYWTRLGWVAAGIAGLTDRDTALTSAPFSYIDAQWNTVMCMFARATLVVRPRFSASRFVSDLRRHRVTFCYVLGTMPALLLKQPPHPDDLDNDLRLVTCSAIPAALHRDLEQRWGAPWRETYGMTESGVDLVSFPEDTHLVGSGLVGKAVPGKQVRIVDADGHDVPDGRTGELITSGKPMMLGYWNLPAVTADVLCDGWLHTGDLVRREGEGFIRVVGRLKDMVRRGGENVSAAEVEAVLVGHQDVAAAAIVPVADALFGEEIKAFVQLVDGVAADRDAAQRIVDHARGQVARFKVPRYVEFVDDFPKTPSERIAKPRLVERAADATGRTYDLQPARGLEARA